jgi:hypothetical protein
MVRYAAERDKWAAHRALVAIFCLPTHTVKRITKALLSRMTNVKAGRYEGAAFTSLFIDDSLRRTRRKVHSLKGR